MTDKKGLTRPCRLQREEKKSKKKRKKKGREEGKWRDPSYEGKGGQPITKKR